MKRKYKSNAERQKAYRERHRNAHDSVTPPIGEPAKPVTVRTKDDCPRLMYLCTIFGERIYAIDAGIPMCSPGRCKFCDEDRDKRREKR